MTTAFSCSQQNNARTPFQRSIQAVDVTVSADKCCYWCILAARTKPGFIRSLINFNTVSVFAQSCPTLPLMNFTTHKSTTLPQWEAARPHALMRTSSVGMALLPPSYIEVCMNISDQQLLSSQRTLGTAPVTYIYA